MFVQEKGREPTLAELAETLNLPLFRLDFLLKIIDEPFSIQSPRELTSGEEIETDDIEDSTKSSEPETVLDITLLHDELTDYLQTLSKREIQIISLHYGLVGGEVLTLEEIGKILGITRERVRQIEFKALAKLRKSSRLIRIIDESPMGK